MATKSTGGKRSASKSTSRSSSSSRSRKKTAPQSPPIRREAGAAVCLMLAVFALQDSFGTACNITGDGALVLMLTGYAEKHGIKAEQIQTVDL